MATDPYTLKASSLFMAFNRSKRPRLGLGLGARARARVRARDRARARRS